MSLRRLRQLATKGGQPLRIGIARVTHETNAFNPVPTELDDFERAHFLEGAALLAACEAGAQEVAGYVANAELSGAVRGIREAGATPVPLMSVWAIPSGPVSDAALRALHARLQAALDAAGPLDAIVVAMHGAMTSVHDHLPEVGLLERLRGHLGPDAPLVLTLDLHAHVGPAKVAAVTALLAYQTNPHRDHARTGYKAALLAAALARGRARVHQAWHMLPMVIGGGTTLDFLPTMLPAFWRLWRTDRREEVLHASLLMSHLWHDAPDLGWASHVITDASLDPDGDRARAHADALAQALWDVRDVPPPDFYDVPQLIALAKRRPWLRRLGVIGVSDASDNVAAGGHGANSNLVRELLAHGHGLLSYVPLKDARATEELSGLPVGSPVDRLVGGNVDPERCPPTRLVGRIRGQHQHDAFGRMVVVDAGHVQVVLTERPPLAMKPAFYRDVGLDPWKADLVVAKSFFHFRIYFAALARKVVYVRTRGITDLDLPLSMTFAHPVHPTTPIDDWRPHDRVRRGVT